MSAQLKSNKQLACIFGLAKGKGLDNEELHALVEETTRKGARPGKTSLAALTFTEADAVIVKLGGKPFAARRTVQYRRKQAGVVQLAQPAHLALLNDLARQRSLSEAGLASLAGRMHLHYPPRTTAETNKLIEALKAIIGRAA
jgi:hypothetical protein